MQTQRSTYLFSSELLLSSVGLLYSKTQKKKILGLEKNILINIYVYVK